MDKIKIALIDDQVLFLDSLAELLRSQPNLEVVFAATSGLQGLQQLAQVPLLPDVILVDMAMPEINGPELTAKIRSQYPAIKVIILSIYGQERYVGQMITAGAVGYLVKDCGKEELFTAIQAVMKAGFYMNQRTLEAVRQSASFSRKAVRTLNQIPVELTAREQEVLTLICKGLANEEMARRLFVSKRTIEGHRTNLLLKTGSANTAALVIFALKNDLFDLHDF